MSAFEISVTPTRPKSKNRLETREPTAVMMAPFSAKAIVQFEDVPITKTAKRILRIINPSDEDIEVKVTKLIPTEHNISISWTTNIVPAQNEISMEMVWNPQIEIACKETLHLIDNRNFRKDVMVILKSKSNVPPKNTRKFPTVGKTLRLKSPTGSIKPNKIAIQQQQRKRLSTKAAVTTCASSISNANLQQSKIQSAVPQKAPPKKYETGSDLLRAEFCIQHAAPLTEKNIYLESREPDIAFESPTTIGYKENVSPITPGNLLSLIDKMKFTPATDTKPQPHAFENLTVCPTSDIRPRRLAADLTHIDDNNLSHTVTNTISNKTFDIKRELDLSNDMTDCSRTDDPLQMPTLNKTTTISHAPMRPLDVIREEDAGSPPNKDTIMEIKAPHLDLKRDIKMVGSPLRKFSESMKDLSLVSPQTKLAIQGSMPNLNEMEQIRSIEQNRYYQHQAIKSNQRIDSNVVQKLKQIEPTCPSSLDSSIASETSLISHNELNFNQNEILAQSSRFNLHEIGMKSRKSSPMKSAPRMAANTNTASKNCNNTLKRRSNELSFSDAPSTESLCIESGYQKAETSISFKTRNKIGTLEISPPKRKRIESLDTSTLRNQPINASASRVRTWTQMQPKKLKLAHTLSLMKKPATPRKMRDEQPSIKLYDSDLYLQTYLNPDPFAATTTTDPFMASTMYLDEGAVNKHQADFKKWLNALVSLPSDLDTDCNKKIDVGKLFNEVRNKELIIAPTKEEQSMNYLTKFRLESLRRAAVELFFSEEMRLPCSKVAVYVNKLAIKIRSDRNLHLDVVMQRTILELLLCFNPLWLRLGLEVVFAEKIHLQANSDIVGLSTFILNRLFRNKSEEQKFSKAYTLTEEYAETIKKYSLQKILFLLLFLDKAKEKCIIKHNPCLFVKKSPHKETKDILLRFASELLANIGDITREMKRLGYVLIHKQTYLDEFDYAFNNLAVDLRDGIRLTRVMEVILLRDGLSKQLRVPAISRLQRIFNVNLALKALHDANFQLRGEITAADIVDGHREKTLSLLWQIIYKFRSPKFHSAARVLQLWWRHVWLRVVIMRRIRKKEEMRRNKAATVIQTLFRGNQTRKYVKVYKEERIQAAIILQKYVRRYLAQKQLYRSYASIVLIQRFFRNRQQTLAYRSYFLRQRKSAIFLQRIWRRRLFAGKLLLAAEQARLQREQKAQAAAMCIQMHWRAHILGKQARMEYNRKLNAILTLQQHIRAKFAMINQRQIYVNLRSSVIKVQCRYRAIRLMRVQRKSYETTRALIMWTQQRWKATIQMRPIRMEYLKKQRYANLVQQKMRATWKMRQEREKFNRLRWATCVIQRRYRARLAMKQQRDAYQIARNRVLLIQRKWRATKEMRLIRVYYLSLVYYTTQIQQRYRSTNQMRQERLQYLNLRKVVINIQRRYRAKLLGYQVRENFLRLKSAAITIQRYFRSYKLMRFVRAKYRGTRAAVTCLQSHLRGFILMKQQRQHFLKIRAAAIALQRTFRAQMSMRKERLNFFKVKNAATKIQRKWRATLEMRQQKDVFVYQRNLIIAIQRRFRSKLLGRRVRQSYADTVAKIVNVQTRFRATLEMRRCRQEYMEKRELIIFIQQRYRARLAMKRDQVKYRTKYHAVKLIQIWYRSIKEMIKEKIGYKRLRSSSITIQRKWRATQAARIQRERFIETVKKVRLIQSVLRATLAMRREEAAYKRKRNAAIVFQRRYRARLTMLQLRNQYLLIRSLVVCIQQKFRARRAMIVAREDYLLLKRTTIHLQQKHRGKLLVRSERQNFMLLRSSIVDFQAHVRGLLARRRLQDLMTPEMVELRRQKKAAKIIQRYWRGYRIRKRIRSTALIGIRKRVVKLRQESKVVNSVRCKMQDAVRFLRGRFNTSDALTVLNQLDRLSRTVPHLLMWSSEFMSTFCYGIMAQAIRSEVDKLLIECCSRIILNLARYNSTTANTFQEGGLVTIAQMLLRWCDKPSEIFNTLCTLIWVFIHDPKKRKIIHNFMTTTDAIYMLRETKKLVARKEKMKQNARKPPPGALRNNAHQQTNFSALSLPSLEPDFGIIRSCPYTFISSVYAFDTIITMLGIDI